MDAFLDVFFLVVHTILVAFNLFGWLWKKTRRLHLVSITLTLASWFGLGLVYGVGYCPCTEWHWKVKESIGERNLPASYVKYYVDALTGGDWDAQLVDATVAALGLGAFAASIYVNVRDSRRSLRAQRNGA